MAENDEREKQWLEQDGEPDKLDESSHSMEKTQSDSNAATISNEMIKSQTGGELIAYPNYSKCLKFDFYDFIFPLDYSNQVRAQRKSIQRCKRFSL